MQLLCRQTKPSRRPQRAWRRAKVNAGKAKGPGNNAEALAKLAPEEGFEPPAKRLTAACSTTELLRIRASHPLPRNLARERELGGAPPDGRAYSKQFHKLQTSLTTNL